MGRRNHRRGSRARHQILSIPVTFTIGKECGKRRFDTYDDAELVLAMALGRNLQGDAKRREQRIYRCLYCGGGFHLTSQEQGRDTRTDESPVR